MAIKKKGDKKEAVVKHDIKVTRAKELENVIMFDMEVNGITIYGCSYRTLTRKDNGEEFVKIGFPSHKSGNNWYNYVCFKITDEDIDVIERGIEALI